VGTCGEDDVVVLGSEVKLELDVSDFGEEPPHPIIITPALDNDYSPQTTTRRRSGRPAKKRMLQLPGEDAVAEVGKSRRKSPGSAKTGTGNAESKIDMKPDISQPRRRVGHPSKKRQPLAGEKRNVVRKSPGSVKPGVGNSSDAIEVMSDVSKPKTRRVHRRPKKRQPPAGEKSDVVRKSPGSAKSGLGNADKVIKVKLDISPRGGKRVRRPPKKRQPPPSARSNVVQSSSGSVDEILGQLVNAFCGTEGHPEDCQDCKNRIDAIRALIHSSGTCHQAQVSCSCNCNSVANNYN